MHKIYILYHANCFDGTGAAYAAWEKFGDAENVAYIPVQYNQPLPEIDDGSEVYIVDFSYARDVLEALRGRVATLVVLDHHKTAAEALDGFPGAVFDMTKSGAILAWEYFHPGLPASRLLQIVQDRDLWQFKLPETKRVTAALPLLKGSLPRWDEVASSQSLIEDYRDIGASKLEFDDAYVKSKLKGVKVVTYFDTDFKCGIVNTTTLISELGNAICEDKDLAVDFAICFFVKEDGLAVLSYRSVGSFDVSVLAKGFGGGGHKNASGSTVSLATLGKLLGV